MADARLFAKFDLGYFDNPKIADFVEDHPRVIFLHQRAFLYCRQRLTDGEFPVRLVARMVCATYCGSQCDAECDYCRGVQSGLFERVDDRTGIVHDYLEHQDSADQVTRRSKAGKKAASARWDSDAQSGSHTKGIAHRSAEGNAEERRGEESRGEPETPARADVEALCEHLASRIESNGAKRPTVGKKWHDSARLLLDRDLRPQDEAHRLIDWCQDSDFWRSNVLSMATFREKYDRLRMQKADDAKVRPIRHQSSEDKAWGY